LIWLEAQPCFASIRADGHRVVHRMNHTGLAHITPELLAGIDRSNLAGRSFSMLLSPNLRAAFKDFLVMAFWEGFKQSIDTVITSGSAPPRIVSVKVLSSANGEECNAVMTDITERTQGEEWQKEDPRRPARHEGARRDDWRRGPGGIRARRTHQHPRASACRKRRKEDTPQEGLA
jgi:hypothetical protein